MVTLKDIAEKANVSIATVSRVLNNKAGSIGIEDTAACAQVAKRLSAEQTCAVCEWEDTEAHLIHLRHGSQDDFFLHPFYHHMPTCSARGSETGYYLSYVGLNAGNTRRS